MRAQRSDSSRFRELPVVHVWCVSDHCLAGFFRCLRCQMLAGNGPVKNIAAVAGRKLQFHKHSKQMDASLCPLGLELLAVWKCEKHRFQWWCVAGGVHRWIESNTQLPDLASERWWRGW